MHSCPSMTRKSHSKAIDFDNHKSFDAYAVLYPVHAYCIKICVSQKPGKKNSNNKRFSFALKKEVENSFRVAT